MITAICYDECGTEVSIEVESLDEIPPEYKYRYSQKHTERELAEWRLSMQDDRDDYDYGNDYY